LALTLDQTIASCNMSSHLELGKLRDARPSFLRWSSKHSAITRHFTIQQPSTTV